jgi:adenylate kinase
MKKIIKTIFIFFGPPGSGKGTQAEMIAKKFKIPRISTGDLLRDEIKQKTKIGKEVEKIMAKGKLVPEKIIKMLILNSFNKKNAKKGFILDGYPRNISQQKDLTRAISERDKVLAILVDVSDKEVKARLGGRRMCACGAVYHLKYNPPIKKGICDLCDGKLFIREDDKPSVISDRLKVYHKEIAPVLKHWEKNSALVKIDGDQSIKAVQRDILKSLEKISNI